MSMNWREIALILSELPMEGSLIQRVNQIGFHALTFELHHPKEGFWQLYVEVGTPDSRIHRLTGAATYYRKQKTAKLQRFIQYMRAHIEGGRIVAVSQPHRDRVVQLKVTHSGEFMNLIFRFYSGPGANVLVCDDQMVIKELLYRRPNREETAGHLFKMPEEQKEEDDGRFPVREYPRENTFNAYMEHLYGTQQQQESPQQLIKQVENLRDTKVAQLQAQLRQADFRVEKSGGFDSYRISGDLLSGATHLVKPQMEWVEVPDYTSTEEQSIATIALDPTLSAGENIANYYKKYQKGKSAWEHAKREQEEIQAQLQKTVDYFSDLLTPEEGEEYPDLKKLKEVLKPPKTDQGVIKRDPYADAPGLRFTSSVFTILVGRNAKENETLLRRYAKGNDWWLHTRDVPGGYVIIKHIAGKTVPLETLLDAGNLALLFSKAKGARKADLYYTQVKYLKRPKGGKQGLVLPTQEKNLSVQLDDGRIRRLFSDSEPGVETWTT